MRHYLTIIILLVFVGLASGQTTISGRVYDDSQLPLPGASVRTGDNSSRTLTDSSGYFRLQVPSAAVNLIVSFVGYKPREISVTRSTAMPLNIRLQPADTRLEEVTISTGYQTLPRERATGAFTVVSNKTLGQQVSTDILSRLEAVTNGLNMDRGVEGSGIRIRGISTLSPGSGLDEPLIVVDNFPYEGNINNINPNDIETVTVLKDAAASSIWGARAGNGVIVITTKNAKADQPLRIETNMNITTGTKPDLDYFRQMTSSEFLEVERFLFSKEHRFSDTASLYRPTFTPAYEILFKQRNGILPQGEADVLLNNLEKGDLRSQYKKYIYEKPFSQQYSVSLSAGSKNSDWLFSSGYDKNVSDLKASYDRLNVSFKQNFRPFKSLQLSSGIYYTQSRSVSGRSGYSLAGGLPPYTSIANGDGSPVPVMKDYRQPYLDTLGSGKLKDWNYYPLTDDEHNKSETSLTDALLNFGLLYTLPAGFTLNLKYQYEKQKNDGNLLHDDQGYYARNLINGFSVLNQGGTVTYRVPQGGILDRSGNKLSVHNLRGQLNFNRTLGKHGLAALGGAEVRDKRTSGFSYRTYGYDPDILTSVNVDYTNTYPNLITGEYLFIPDNSGVSEITNRFVSGFANAGYTYDKRYAVTLSARKDASNLFGVHTNDKWNLLWSAGGAWNISSESFYRSEFLPYLKLRGTYGFSGNVDLNRSAVTTIAYLGTSAYTLTPTAYINQNANPDLRWEKIRMTNVAVDFATRNDRLSGSVDFYIKRATDLFGPAPIDPTSGISGTVIKNAASLKGTGVDAELHSRNIDGQFIWTSDLNLSYYKDKVTDYYMPDVSASDLVTTVSRSPTFVVGKPLYSLYSYKWQGLDPESGDPVGFINGHNSKNWAAITGDSTHLDDLVYSGSAVPVFYGSLGNTFTWKNFSLTARLMFKLGYYFRNEGINYSALYDTRSSLHREYSSRWQNPGDEQRTNVPSRIYPADPSRDDFYTNSEIKVEKGDHVRLQYINIGYTLDAKQSRRVLFQRVLFFCNINNPGIIWRANKAGIDPEYGSASLPPATSYSIGIKVSM